MYRLTNCYFCTKNSRGYNSFYSRLEITVCTCVGNLRWDNCDIAECNSGCTPLTLPHSPSPLVWFGLPQGSCAVGVKGHAGERGGTCCSSRILMARSVEENIFTMTGMIFCWYSSVDRNFPTWQRTRGRDTQRELGTFGFLNLGTSRSRDSYIR